MKTGEKLIQAELTQFKDEKKAEDQPDISISLSVSSPTVICLGSFIGNLLVNNKIGKSNQWNLSVISSFI